MHGSISYELDYKKDLLSPLREVCSTPLEVVYVVGTRPTTLTSCVETHY